MGNQNAIVEAVRAHGELSKARIAELTGLSMPTVSRLIRALTEQGYIEQAGVEEPRGGRPAATVRVVPLAVLAGAVQAHADRVLGALVGFDGAIVERVETAVPFAGERPGPAAVRETIAELIARAGARGGSLRGIGVSLAGVTDRNGPVTGLEPTRWSDFAVRDIEEGFEVPVIVENDANALAIGELYRGAGRDTRHFVALVLDRGLGAGIVANGELYRGARSAAGEVGYLLLGSDSLTRRVDDRGELESVLEPAAVTARARGVGIDLGRELTAPEVIALAADGDARAAELAEDVLDGLARGIAALSSILDPQVVILGEGLDLRTEVVIPAIENRLRDRVQTLPEIRTATLGADAVLLGASEMALRDSGALVPARP